MECEGTCDKHVGEIKQVKVTRPWANEDWGKFWYCQIAIEADRKKGFTVEYT